MAENFYQKRTKKIIWSIFLCPFIFIIAVLPLRVFAQAYDATGIIYVNQNAQTKGDGSSWSAPLGELRDALIIAISDNQVHQIWVAAGTYKPTTSTNKTISFNIPGGLSVYGGFSGSESNISDRNIAANPTNLSGDIGVTGDNTDNSYNVVTIQSAATLVTVDGFIITGANNTNPETTGGGLVIRNTVAATLNQLIITGNKSAISGGTDIEYSTVTINQSVISNNTATAGDAGGMGVYNAVVTMNNTVFDGNVSMNATGNFAEGGGLELDGTLGGGTNVTCNNCVFNNNQANNNTFVHGGAIMNFGGTLNLTNTTLYNNTVTSANFAGSNGVTDEGNDDNTALNFVNTIIWSNQSLNLAIDESTYPASLNISYSDIAGGIYGPANNISADPLFANPTNPIGADGIWDTADDGLVLSCLSPAHYTGTSSGATANDITGASRPNPPDMGAYQQNGTPVQPSVSIDITSGGNCPGADIIFTATPTSGGSNPSYQWQVNGNNVGTNSQTMEFASLNPGDVVSVILTTDYTVCVSTMTANSNTITIKSLPQVNASTITTVNAGSPYLGQQITASGGATPYSFSVSAGLLPNGITLGDDGTLFGTSNTPGSYQFTVQVTESGCGNIATQTFSADINGLSSLALSTGVLNTPFDPATTNYNVSVPNATSAISFTPTAGNQNVLININGTAVLSGSPSSFIALNVGDNTIQINETAQDQVTVNTYTITVTRAPSSVATLDNLQVSSGTLSPQFSSNAINYSVDVPAGTTSINVTPTLTDLTATVTVNGEQVSSGSSSSDIPLIVGGNTIMTVVTAQDGTTTDTYTITVNLPPSTIATLTNLAVSSGTLNPSFDQATNNYEDDVDNSVTSINVTPTLTDQLATVTVNGVGVQSGNASGDIGLNVGPNTITTVVTAQDGSTTDTYIINVVRAPSSNANLTNLTASSGTLTPAFDQGTTNYEDDVDNGVTTITITPTAADATATITVNGNNVQTGNASPDIALNVGSNTITTIVTAQDGTTTNTYTINVVRALSSNANLTNLTVSTGTLNPSFDQGTTDYEDDVDNSITSINVTPTVSDANATVTVNGTGVQSGSSSGDIALNVGPNSITTVVTAQDGNTTNTYTINVVRAASSNAALNNLTVSNGTLTPAFATGTANYQDDVDNNITSINVTPTVAEPNATIMVNGNIVQSGNPSGDITLNVGPNTITTIVTAQDGTTTNTYTIVVNRAASSNANLANLTVSNGTLTPAFNTGTNNYEDDIANSITSINVTPTVADVTATVTVNGLTVQSGSPSGDIALNMGPNSITTIVTAQDGTTTDTYTINVVRAPSSNANLANLTVSNGTLTPVFDTGTTDYEDDVDNSITSITVTPTVTDATATITVNGATVASGSASASIALNVGNNTITTIVTAQDGTTTNTYKINVVRAPSSNAGLANLSVNYGTLTPTFDTGTTAYVDDVDNAIAAITITPTAADATATITVNGSVVQSGNASGDIALNVGPNTITTIVTAQDGTTTDTYTVVVNRGPSSKTALANLTISSGILSPAFAPGTANYTDTVSNTITAVAVTPTAADVNATITVNNVAVATGFASQVISLNPGANVITTVVTAQDGTSTQTYTITVTRARAVETITFSALADVSYGSPDFNPGATSNSGLPIIYTSSDLSVATIVNGKIHIIAPGNTTITASVASDPNYSPATPVSQPLTVTKADQTISTITIPAMLSGSEVDLSGIKASSGLPVVFSISDETIVTIKGDSLLALQVGTATLTVTQAGNNFYNPAESVYTVATVVIDEDNQLVVHPAVTPNGDGINDFLLIEGIKNYPQNTVTLANRNGVKIYSTGGYDNESRRFEGRSNISNEFQPAGTYFYLIDYISDGRRKHKTGFIVLKY